MSGFETLAALLDKPALGDRPDHYAGLRHDEEGAGELAPGAAIVAAAGFWLAEHWPAILIGAAAGMIGLAIPALVVARLLR